ncbi:hypothetical protein NHQ30_008827 [Ciborinia camelliae]|nr:hypothetical protein NHQ30_008827 [Ciborinia camelliae]
MPRTKTVARKGPAGKEFRDNQKRKREEAAAAAAGAPSKRKGNFPSTFQESEPDQDRPSKKAKSTTTSALQTTSHQAQPQKTPSATAAITSTPTPHQIHLQIPAPHDLTPAHQTTHLSILSSSQIQKKVSRILSILGTFSFSDPSPHVVLLSAKAPVGCKLISIAEIAKRELAKSGKKWYQYNVVGQLSTVVPRHAVVEVKDVVQKEGERQVEGDVEMKDEGEEEEAFETMKTPFERALEAEGRPKIRCVATLSLYLSRVRIESLKKIYGEQTNALT